MMNKNRMIKYLLSVISLSIFLFEPTNLKAVVKFSDVVDKSISDSLRIGVAVTTRNLMKLAEPAFAAKYPGIKISSYIHETGNVVEDVISGKTSVAVTTRTLKDYEKKRSASIMGTPIGIDGLVLVVSQSIPINSLSFDQIIRIWTGKYTNWNQVGGPNLPIVLIGRTKAYDPIKLFDDFMQLKSKLVDNGLVYSEASIDNWGTAVAPAMESDDQALQLLEKTKGAITYFPLQVYYQYISRKHDVKALAFDSITANYKTIDDGSYHIHRQLNVITNGKPQGVIKAFVDFILSDEGQRLVKESGFLPLQK
jgi:phosphate transport system substrate-binding protein